MLSKMNEKTKKVSKARLALSLDIEFFIFWRCIWDGFNSFSVKLKKVPKITVHSSQPYFAV